MDMYPITGAIIICVMLCMVPWTLLIVAAIGIDSFRRWYRRRYPQRMLVAIHDFEAIPAHLAGAHHWLLGLGFEPLCIAESHPMTGAGKEWIYVHRELPTLLARNTEKSDGSIVEFITQFKKLTVVTLYGSDAVSSTPHYIVNEVSTGITPAFEFHQNVVDTEYAYHGEPLPLNTAELYLEWATAFRVAVLNSQSSRTTRWDRVYAVLSVGSMVIGLVSLYLMHTRQLAHWQAVNMTILLCAAVVMHIVWIGYLPRRNPSVEERFKQKNAVG